MSTDRWPQPPFHPKDYPALLELLGQEEFERQVCPLDVARERYLREEEGVQAEGANWRCLQIVAKGGSVRPEGNEWYRSSSFAGLDAFEEPPLVLASANGTNSLLLASPDEEPDNQPQP